MISQEEATFAAQRLIRTFGAVPPQAHSVWIKCTVDPETKQFTHKICVSEHPKFKDELEVPEEFGGVPVEKFPWPKEMR